VAKVEKSVRLGLKVIPGARMNSVQGWQGDLLKLRVNAAPEKGKANKAVCKLLAEVLNIRMDQISLLRGETSPIKMVEIENLSATDLRNQLKEYLNT
jgi:uncharacterized protein (TIGR00251 family)